MNDHLIIGLDIGGANTKATLLDYQEKKLIKSFSYIEYFPFWEKTIDDIPQMLQRIVNKLSKRSSILQLKKAIDYIAITITAELSDAFQTKKEGISTILKALEEVFKKEKLYFISNKLKFLSFKEAKGDHNAISAANWVSTALFLGKFYPNCILIDAGSTTIDIIPILESKPIAKGYNDITRMMNHELIYTGGLRATIPSITHFVPYQNEMVRISFEKFALISDVHRILGNISEEEYINDTADNRSKSLNDCYARLARIICMDLNMISREELDHIANYIYEQQRKMIQNEFNLFYRQLKSRISQFSKLSTMIITGLSASFLIRPCLEYLGFTSIKNYEQVVDIPNQIISSAFAVAGALYNELR